MYICTYIYIYIYIYYLASQRAAMQIHSEEGGRPKCRKRALETTFLRELQKKQKLIN